MTVAYLITHHTQSQLTLVSWERISYTRPAFIRFVQYEEARSGVYF